MTKTSRPLILFIAAMLQPAAAVAQSDKVADDYETYDKIRVIAAEMFTEFLNENIVAIRISATLKYCSKDGLAKAIEATEGDRSFKDKLVELTVDGRFSGLPSYAVLQAQTAANNLVVGYNFGFIEALKLTPDSGKSHLCAIAVEGANKILAK